MKFLSIAACACLLFLSAGCAVYTPSASVVIDPAGPHAPAPRGNFCPPGQAKKGNC